MVLWLRSWHLTVVSGMKESSREAFMMSQGAGCWFFEKLDKRKEPDASGSSQVLSEDVHRNS